MHLRSGTTYVNTDHSQARSVDTYTSLMEALPPAVQARLPPAPLYRTDTCAYTDGRWQTTFAAKSIREENERRFRKMIKLACNEP